jgi:hypothetical protein
MSHPLLDRHAHVALLVRSRSLRLRACAVLERATLLRRQAEDLLSFAHARRARRDAPRAPADGADPPDEAEAMP